MFVLSDGLDLNGGFFWIYCLFLRARDKIELQETKYCMPYPTPVTCNVV